MNHRLTEINFDFKFLKFKGFSNKTVKIFSNFKFFSEIFTYERDPKAAKGANKGLSATEFAKKMIKGETQFPVAVGDGACK